jgi:archaellum component FlaC
MSRSDEISQRILFRVQLARERVKQILRDLENLSGELNALYDYAMNHDMENIADEIGIIDFDLTGVLDQMKKLSRELQALEYEVTEDEQEE